VTVCSPCGHWNRLPCTAEDTEPCSAGLAIDTQGKVANPGTCIGCGTNKRPVCTRDGEEPCENGYYEKDGYCYTCGIEGAAFCEGQNKCLPGYTPMLGATEACTRCGYKDMPACANPNESPCSNGLGVNHDSGLCEYCGTAGKPGCETTCEPCRTGLALD
ncbi:Tyrosine kinase, putative, partial [Hondaea fermentalgiana]